MAADALVIIDMQAGSFGPDSPARYDAEGQVERLNALASWVRSRDGLVVWVQHDGAAGDGLEPGTDGWGLLPSLEARPGDETIRKTACDSFLGTGLEALLRARSVGRVIVTGWATDFCVDTTVRSCTAKGFESPPPRSSNITTPSGPTSSRPAGRSPSPPARR